MPMMDIFESRTVMTEDEIRNALENHEGKIRNLRLTILDFLFDAELKQDFMSLKNIAIRNPEKAIIKRFAAKYGRDFENSLTNTERTELTDAKAKSEAFRHCDSIGFEMNKNLSDIRKICEDILPHIDEILEAIDLSKLGEISRCMPPEKLNRK